MKIVLKFSLVLFSLLFFISSCNDDDKMTYAEELKIEKKLIQSYVKRKNINILTELPKTNNWGPNDYYLSESGLYFRLTNPGITSEGADTLRTNDIVVLRYKQYELTENPDTIFNMTTSDSTNPYTFNYLDYSQSSTALHEAVKYMNRNESEATIIVPSKISFETYLVSVTPLCYELKMKIKKY